MKKTTPLSLLALAVAAGSAALSAAPAAMADPAPPTGPAPTDVCAQQLAVAPVVGRWTGTLHSACKSGAEVNNLVHHPLG